MDTMSRRDFIQRSAGVVAGAAAASSLLAFGRRAMAQDDELRVAVLGINGRGTAHISAFMNLPGCRVAALCHAQPLALPRDHLGLPSGQGRLRREAAVVGDMGGAAGRQGGAEVRSDRAGGHPGSLGWADARGDRAVPAGRCG